MRELTLQINGMSCGHCLNAVNRALAGIPGVEIVSVQIGRAALRYDADLTTPDVIGAALLEAGYPAAVAGE